MKKNKKAFKWTCIALGAAFLLVLTGRVVYEYKNPEASSGGLYFYDSLNSYSYAPSADSRSVKNYVNTKAFDASFGADFELNQQYEKIADLSSKSKDFEEDEKNLYESIERNKCVVQLESKTGLPGRRIIQLTLGVKPERFDEAVKELSTIGELLSMQTTKTDKTAEYKSLLAERAALEKTKESYVALRQRGGSLSELLTLEQKIIEVERQLQEQDVLLSDFTVDEGLCTVNFSLTEADAIRARSFANIFETSLEWTVLAYLSALGLLAATLVFVSLLFFVILLGRKGYVLLTAVKPPKGE